jgi:GMP synthase (glutamine-hydrolysing)
MKPLLIIRTGRAPDIIRARLGDFPLWFRLGLRVSHDRLHVVDVERGDDLPPAHDVAGAVITGSASMVTERLPWSERTSGWIRDAMDVDLPLFGVCYGHQLMAHALGGRVDYLPGGREMGTQTVEKLPAGAGDVVAGTLPSRFRAHLTHEQSVLELPRGAQVLARSERDPHQLLRYGKHAVSTQFHPEFSADIMRAYIRRKASALAAEGQPPAAMFAGVGATPVARGILRSFVREHVAQASQRLLPVSFAGVV